MWNHRARAFLLAITQNYSVTSCFACNPALVRVEGSEMNIVLVNANWEGYETIPNHAKVQLLGELKDGHSNSCPFLQCADTALFDVKVSNSKILDLFVQVIEFVLGGLSLLDEHSIVLLIKQTFKRLYVTS